MSTEHGLIEVVSQWLLELWALTTAWLASLEARWQARSKKMTELEVKIERLTQVVEDRAEDIVEVREAVNDVRDKASDIHSTCVKIEATMEARHEAFSNERKG